PHVVVGHFGGEVFGRNSQGWEEVGQRARLNDAEFRLHHLGCVAAEQGGISFGSDSSESIFVHPTLEDVVREGFFGGPEFVPGLQPAKEADAFLNEFLFSRLEGKVALGEGDRLLPGVSVLGDQVAGIAGQHEVLDFALPALAVGDQFRDATKMMFRFVTRCLTRLNGPLNGSHEVFPTGIAERFLKIAGEPKFDPVVIRQGLSQRIKVALHAMNLFDVHKSTGLQVISGHLANK
ncbi:MAG: hypothetical protein MUF13_00320, partial [Akkermansiaceae bacterium]|nr:hypothetical protein [Akkermansiaceae bacterium]